MGGAKFQLGAMMFLQYAIWGAWAPVLSAHLFGELSFTGAQVGFVYSLLPLATIIAPFVGGQLADRYFASEKVIAVLQLAGGGMLMYASTVTEYGELVTVMLVYCLLYAPTLALTNSIAMSNLESSEDEFGRVRVWGTIGWIAAGWALTAWRTMGGAGSGDMLMLAGVFSIVMGLQSFMLPHTPPNKESSSPWAFLEALRMLGDRNFATFMAISFVVATELQFYYVLTGPYLESARIGIASASVPAVMTIAQIAEIFVVAVVLSWFLKKYGMRATLALGVIAWPIRYVIFAIGAPWWLVVASLTLHGFCYVFFFVAAFIYVDGLAPPDIRGSAQSLIAIVTLGIGSFVGSNFAGWVQNRFTVDGVTDWTTVFLVPCAITIGCAVAYLLFFKDDREPAVAN
ncbi:MAG: MFS transporter [Acidobacteria bacterium]|nr:MFS transporter [Acidobacteriota bacterium]